ncbi:MAG: response regulator [Anaerolineae bacterium]|nr:response regulator [Anaerolineae bacterium]
MKSAAMPLEEIKTTAMPVTLQEWRTLILNWILRGMLAFWLILLIWGFIVAFIIQTPTDSPTVTPILIGIYTISALITFTVTYFTQLGFKVRAVVFLALLYSFGVIDLLLQGFNGEGQLYLLAFVALVAVFFDLRRSIYALILSFITIILITILQAVGMLPNASLIVATNSPDYVKLLNGSVVFIVLSILVVLSITYLINSLETSLAQAQKEKDFANAVLEKSGTLVVLFEPDGKILRFNRASEIISGYLSHEMIGNYAWDYLLTPDGADLTKTAFAQINADLEPVSYEGYWRSKNGQRSLIAWYCAPLVGENNQVESIISTGVDITSYKETEADRSRLFESEQEQRLFAETLAEVTLSLTSQTHPEDVLDNILRQVQRIVPFKAAHIALLEGDMLRVTRWQGYEAYGEDNVFPNMIQSLASLPLDREVVATRKPLVVADTRQNPNWQFFEGNAWVRSYLCVPILQQDEVLGLLRIDGDQANEFSQDDAHSLQNLANTMAIALANSRLMQETRQKARQVQRILDTVHDGILLLDGNYQVELVNPAASSYLPLLTDTPIGEPIKLLAGQPIRNIVQPPPAGALWHEIVLNHPQMTFEAVAQPIEAGGWVLVIRDITESRKQQQYVQAQERLAMVGQMAAGIAHDFNNIMTVIILYTQMLLKSPELPDGLVTRMNTIFDQSKLAANLISQILDFSRQSDMKRRPVHMLPFLKELTKMLKRTLPENIDIRLDFDEGDYIINADLTRMQQVVMNLVVNSRDAMPKGGTLRLDLAQLVVEESKPRPLPDMQAGEWIRLQVIDTGMGIPPQNLEHIFEPLFTTKERGKGTGLGLAQVYGIVKQHDGFVNVVSAVGEGTTFTLYLPVQRAGDFASLKSDQMVLVSGHGEKILVVEDDEITRKAICAILETFNYETSEAVDASEAIRLFEFFADDIALVLSDMVMPGMNGDEMLTYLQAKRPDIRMIIITGYPFADRDRVPLREGIADWLQKPFEVEELVKAIQTALPSSTAG